MCSFNTVSEEIRTKTTAGRCKFYASLSPCSSEQEARALINRVKDDLNGATHHAWAYRLKKENDLLSHCSDDGEPSGTAGLPMLSVLEGHELLNVVVVGSRYFGGVKLGKGGLRRAYRACAESAVNAAVIIEETVMKPILITLPYDLIGAVLKEVEAYSAELIDLNYSDKVYVKVNLPIVKDKEFNERIFSITKGKAHFIQPLQP